MPLKNIIQNARAAQAALERDGHTMEAAAIQRMIVSRTSSASLNRVLHADLARQRALILRVIDAMDRCASDGFTNTEWDTLLADLRTATTPEKGPDHG
jgi:hypothetical protein